LAGCQPQFQPGTFTDDLGREITIDKTPQRIVSHVPGITEMLFALGLEERVVGVSDYCNYPPEAELKPKVGGFFDPSVERIVALNPDLILTNGDVEGLLTHFDSLGMTSIVLQPHDLDGILRDIQLLGRATGAEKEAEAVIDDMQQRMSHVSSTVKGAPKVKVFYTFNVTDLNNPWTAGPGSFIDSLITLAGGDNIGAKALGPWIQFSIEEVVNSNPEVIIVDVSHGTAITSVEGFKTQLREHPAWSEVTAVKQERICPIAGDLINRVGPRIVQGLEEIARSIHPELFE